MKWDSGMKVRVDRSREMYILITEDFPKVKPTDPLQARYSVSVNETKLIRLLVILWPNHKTLDECDKKNKFRKKSYKQPEVFNERDMKTIESGDLHTISWVFFKVSSGEDHPVWKMDHW
jgi:hypothetical protein